MLRRFPKSPWLTLPALVSLAFVGLSAGVHAQESSGEKPQPDGAKPDPAPGGDAEAEAEASEKPAQPSFADGLQEGAPVHMLDGTDLRPDAETIEEVQRVSRRDRERRESWRAQAEASELPERATVLGLTVSGGVSLGSYEAGQIYLLTEALRASPDSAKLMVATGASAGNANALVAAIEACGKTPLSPEESLGYKVWIDVGLDDLFDPSQVTAGALFVQDALNSRFDLLKDAWKEGLPADCDFVFGLAMTRQQGLPVELAEDLVVPRQTERVVVRVRGRREQAPAFFNYLDPSRNYERPLLPLTEGLDKTGERDAEAIRPAVLASMAFPVAFNPVPVPHCTTENRMVREAMGAPSKLPTCDVATRVSRFVDGGVFDNNPLGITFRVARDGLENGPDGKPRFRDIPTLQGPRSLPDLVLGYVDPDLRSYPRYHAPPDAEEKPQETPLLGIATRLGGEVLSSARGQELSSLAERNPEALRRLWLIKANYPPVSELMGAFFGFFERDFRLFDYHLGIYDAFVALRDQAGTMLGVEKFVERSELGMRRELDKVHKDYYALGCMVAHFEPDTHGALAPLCDKTDKNFRALLQLTILRLWSNCRLLSADRMKGHEHLQCIKAQGHLTPPWVTEEFKLAQPYKLSTEDDLDYALRLLEAFDFHYKDLGLKPGQADRGRITVRRKLDEMVRAISKAQPSFAERTLVHTGGRAFVNKIAYEPPVQRAYIQVGSSLAGGYLGRLGHYSAWYWNVDGRLYNLQSLLTDRANQFGGALSLGVELALIPFSGNIFQTSVGLRGGYQPTAEDKLGIDPCPQDETNNDSRLCSQPIIHVPFNLTLIERVRLSLTPIFYPLPQEWGHKWLDLEIGLGAEFW